jgi:hypothetical protein
MGTVPPMTAPSLDWFELDLLDTVDLTQDRAAQAAAVQARLPQLKADLDDTLREAYRALGPVPAGHPTDDMYDDHHYLQKALVELGAGGKSAAYEQARAELDDLTRADDPGRVIAGFVVTRIHDHLKQIGLNTAVARAASGPSSPAGPPLAELLWQTRNQAHHQGDARRYDPPVLDAFRPLITQHPGAFGLAQPPPDDTVLDLVLKHQPWAKEVLILLGWTDPAAVRAGIATITP